MKMALFNEYEARIEEKERLIVLCTEGRQLGFGSTDYPAQMDFSRNKSH